MKIIFILALLIVVGAQEDDSSAAEEENMNAGGEENMGGGGEDESTDSDEDDNDSGAENYRTGRSNKFPSAGKKSKSAIPQEMIEKFMNLCVDVKLPKEMFSSLEKCVKEEAKKSSILDNMLEGNFPDKQELAKIYESIEMCKVKAEGLTDLKKDLTPEKLSEVLMFDKWTGNQKDKEELRQMMISCTETSQGDGFEKINSANKCIVDYYFGKCKERNDKPGTMIMLYAKLGSLHEESKCAPVKISNEMKQTYDECIEEANNNFGKSDQSFNSSLTIKNVPTEVMKSLNFVIRFSTEYLLYGVMKCMGDRTKMYDSTTQKMNMTAMAETVKQFEGWNGIEKERDAVYQAIIECGKEYEDSKEKDNDPPSEQMKDMMEDSEDFDKCFTPKFAQICGYNNELSAFVDPLMGDEFLEKIFKNFKELGGKEAEDVINLMKGLVKKFKEE